MVFVWWLASIICDTWNVAEATVGQYAQPPSVWAEEVQSLHAMIARLKNELIVKDAKIADLSACSRWMAPNQTVIIRNLQFQLQCRDALWIQQQTGLNEIVSKHHATNDATKRQLFQCRERVSNMTNQHRKSLSRMEDKIHDLEADNRGLQLASELDLFGPGPQACIAAMVSMYR